jgi:hypothetical protein
MSHFTVTNLGDEIIGTYDDGIVKNRLVIKRKPSDDFVLDCACIIDTISTMLARRAENEKG